MALVVAMVDAKNIECADDQEATNRPPERFSDLLTLSYEPMLAWRLDGVIEFWNAGAERLYGFSPGEAVGRSNHSLLQTKFPVEFIELHSQLRNDRYWSGELRHICKDGREVIVDSRMQLFSDDTVLEVNRDVTEAKALINERKQIEHALRESEQRLRWIASIVESSEDVIISKNLDGIIIIGIEAQSASSATLPKRQLANLSRLLFRKTDTTKNVKFSRVSGGESGSNSSRPLGVASLAAWL